MNLKLINVEGEKFAIFKNDLFPNPNELCFENIDSNHQISEKYNYNYMIKNPPLNLNINKIKKFISKTLSSNVFKEIFQILIGNEDYNKIFDEKMISEFSNKIKFCLLNFHRLLLLLKD